MRNDDAVISIDDLKRCVEAAGLQWQDFIERFIQRVRERDQELADRIVKRRNWIRLTNAHQADIFACAFEEVLGMGKIIQLLSSQEDFGGITSWLNQFFLLEPDPLYHLFADLHKELQGQIERFGPPRPMRNIVRRWGQIVAYYRREKGLTQKQLAQRAKIPQHIISKIENGMFQTNTRARALAFDKKVERLLKAMGYCRRRPRKAP